MSDHGDEQLTEHNDQESSAPWVTAEKMTALLLAAAVLVVTGGISGAWDGWNLQISTYGDPNDPSAFTSQTPELVERFANLFQGFGQVSFLLIVLGFVALFLVWRHLDDLDIAEDGEAPLTRAEVARAGWWLRGVQVVFALTVVAALGDAFGWWRRISDSAGQQFGVFGGWSAFVPELGTVLAGVAGLIGVAALLRDQRELEIAETSSSAD